jgi:hypothetical protein
MSDRTTTPSGEERNDRVGGSQPGPPHGNGPQPTVERDIQDDVALDAQGIAKEPVGSDTIATGRVAGGHEPPHASRGQGQGGHGGV